MVFGAFDQGGARLALQQILDPAGIGLALAARGVPFGIVRAVDEVVTDPQVLANELFEEHTHPAAGRIRQHRPPTRFHGTPAGLRERSAPTIGQHTDEVVAGTGRGDRLDELRSAGVIG